MLQLNYPFDDGLNYEYETDDILVDSGSASLLIIDNPGQIFTEDFADDTGFTYDSALAEFAAGQVQQVQRVSSDAVAFFTYDSTIDATWVNSGSGTGTAVGSAAVSSNKLDLAHDDLRYVDYDATSWGVEAQVGAVKLKYTPNYSGTPSTHQNFFYTCLGDLSYESLIFLRHRDDGAIQITVKSSSDVAFISYTTGPTWSPTASQEYEIEFNYDVTTGATRLFIDGVQYGVTQTATGTRGSVAFARVGSNGTALETSNFAVADLIIYDAVQHTADYTPGYTLAETAYRYAASAVVLPEMEYTGVETLISFDAFTTTESGAPRYTLQIGRSGNYLYWDGNSWETSDGSYAQATTAATFHANLDDIDSLIEGQIYGQFKVHFDNSDSVQSSVSELSADLTTRHYAVNPQIKPSSTVLVEGICCFEATITASGSDSVAFTIEVSGVQKYWDGAAWSTSSGYSQSNTATEIEDNAADLDFGTGQLIRFVAYLHSDDGTTTPTLDNVLFGYDYRGDTPTDLDECIVYGFVKDPEGNAVSGASVKATYETLWHGGYLIPKETIETTTDSTGYWELSLVETETVEKTVKFAFETDVARYHKIVTVPNEDTAALVDLS